ncbi:probable E3 ubiquitin-protein ligase RHY1A [Malania oleifera]|uniref:probable E3 ubiquitin-protein ligase RHY1A n=1 Tax=Malania oleifera TaxID=397392 RepID=UPI0025ADB8A9|nr:probable E3 ubiquitin-protein ligase RHY1A [Malania oleifera]
MTSASELFYNRRSRLGRATAPVEGLGLDSSPHQRTFHHKCNRRHHNTNHNQSHGHDHSPHHRHDVDGSDPLAGPLHVAHSRHRASHPERESVSLSRGGSHCGSGNSSSTGTVSRINNQLGLTQNGRLPGSVLLARERLLERLRGVSLSGNRRSSRASLSIYRHEQTSDDFSLINTGDWDTESSMVQSAGGFRFIDRNLQGDQLPFLHEPSNKKPPGLTQEALNCLKVEVFSCRGKDIEGPTSRAWRECSVCLDSFGEGDELICLPCAHRFHSACLAPWLRTCGDCPYCRRVIVYR